MINQPSKEIENDCAFYALENEMFQMDDDDDDDEKATRILSRYTFP